MRMIQVASALIAVFFVSLGIMWWRSNQSETKTQASDSVRESGTAPVLPAPNAMRARVRELGGLNAQPPSQPQETTQHIPPASADSTGTVENGLPLPVIVGVIQKWDFDRDSVTNESVRKNVNEGIVSNSTDANLTVTIVDTDIPTQETSQATFVLAKGAQRHFGTHDGLKMVSGDQLILHSPPYSDLVQQIP